jgi:hypothetical protein
VEAWHRIFNSQFRSFHPRLSEFVRKMLAEENHWRLAVEDYQNNPADGIRGRGMSRKALYIQQDANLRAIFNSRNNRPHLEYLKAIAYRMPDEI